MTLTLKKKFNKIYVARLHYLIASARSMIQKFSYFFGVSLLPGGTSNDHEGCCTKVSTNLNCKFWWGDEWVRPLLYFSPAQTAAKQLNSGIVVVEVAAWSEIFVSGWLFLQALTPHLWNPNVRRKPLNKARSCSPLATYLLREPCSVNPRWNKSTMDPREKRCYIGREPRAGGCRQRSATWQESGIHQRTRTENMWERGRNRMLGQSPVSRGKIAWRGQVYPGEKLVPNYQSAHFGSYKTIRTVSCFQVITIEQQKIWHCWYSVAPSSSHHQGIG